MHVFIYYGREGGFTSLTALAWAVAIRLMGFSLLRKTSYILCIFFLSLSAYGTGLEVSWRGEDDTKKLKNWTSRQLQGLKTSVRHERDPKTGRLATWEGVSLRELIENSMKGLTLEQKAEVDLVVIESSGKQRADLPRSMTIKYPMMLAFKRNGKKMGRRGPYLSVVPWSTKTRILTEVLPLEKYFLEGVRKVTLTNYRYQYSDRIFVQKRKDPLVVRGEKRFVQVCLGCHAAEKIPFKNRDLYSMALSSELFSDSHEKIPGFPKFKELDQMGITSYLKQVRSKANKFAFTR